LHFPDYPDNVDIPSNTRLMNMKTMTASVASKEFGRYLDAAQREPVIVTKKGRPVAVTVSLQDWEELTQLRIEHGITQGLADIEAGRFEEMNDTATADRLARFRARTHSAA
jgi:prevent-host-death family protein